MTQNKNKQIKSTFKEDIRIELNDLELINHRYQVISTIEQGSYSEVFKVKDYNDKNIKAAKAFKLKPKEDVESVKHEAQIVMNLQSAYADTYLIKYFDFFHDKPSRVFFLIMEYLEVTKLDNLFDETRSKKKKLPLESIQLWSIQILKGLDFLHSNGLIHKNIKPSNIYVQNNNIVIGEMALLRDPSFMTEYCLEDGLKAVSYMAPEIAKEFINFSNKIDVWAFGCILYEMLELKRLFDGRKSQVIFELLNFQEFKLNLNPNMPSVFQNVIKKSLIVIPDHRFDANSLITLLSVNFKIPVKSPIRTRVRSQTPAIISNEEAQKLLDESDSLFKLSKFNDAIKSLDKLIASKSCKCIECRYYYAESYYRKGRCLRCLSRYKESIQCFNKTININPEHYSAYNYKGFSLKIIGKRKEAMELFEKIDKLNNLPNTPDGYFNKALTLYGLENFEKAINYYDKVLEINKEDAVAYNSKGIALKILGRYKEAFECYTKATELDPLFAYAFNNKGILLSSLNRKELALECFNKAVSLDNNYADAFKNKGNVLLDSKKYEEALKCFIKSIEIDPNNTTARISKGNCLVNMKKYKEAIECFNYVIDFWPNNVDAYKFKGYTLITLKKYPEALECFENILKMEPNNQIALDNKNELLKIKNIKKK